MALTRNAIRTWDATISCSGTTEQALKDCFDKECSKWIFQKEKGEETGYEHYQCRFTLKRKLRFINLREKLIENLGITGFDISATNKNCLRNDEEYYVTKEETRIAWPWKNEKTDTPKLMRNPTLREWQKTIVDEIDNYEEEGR